VARGLCAQCGPKRLTKLNQIKALKLFIDAHTGKVIYLCRPCARELGYEVDKKSTVR
jgi:hypothetical protein